MEDRYRSQNYEKLKSSLLKSGSLFEDGIFPADGSSINKKKPTSRDVRWLRPWEISSRPLFIRENATRFDLDQGELGDCWFVAAASLFAMQGGKMFDNVVPLSQSFESGDYAGIFRFRFWRFGDFVEVVVDDRLPCKRGRLMYCNNREEPNEFWAALLEKAYAKLNGSYADLDGGLIQDALIDFTGGISEVISLFDPSARPPELFDIMQATFGMNTMMGCSINKTTKVSGEQSLPQGLFAGHAYSITAVAKIRDKYGKLHDLVRLRNPWGHTEWTGAWSDRSTTWFSVDADVKEKLNFHRANDGEFWMPFEDFVNNFQFMELVHLSPDAITAQVASETGKVEWKTTTNHGSWIRGVTAGGCGNYPNEAKMWMNPQFYASLDPSDRDEDSDQCTLIVSLMEKQTIMSEYTSIGFQIFKLNKNAPPIVIDESNYKSIVLSRVAFSGQYTNLRQVCRRFELNPGHYVVVPSTFRPGQQSSFLLRIFNQKNVPEIKELDEVTGPTDYAKENADKLREVFRIYAGDDERLDASELHRAMNDLCVIEGQDEPFCVETCRSLLAMMDSDGSGQLTFDEFTMMNTELRTWRSVFQKYDRDNNGYIDVYELCRAFKDIGFPLSKKILGPLVKRYGGKSMTMGLEEFVLATTRVRCMYGAFMTYADGGIRGKVTMDLDQWLATTIYC
ncbi:calpain-B-like isoform X2 [Tubulanus polymorphus]|uniref:calpain-B-like isoform X2 n=1 Tax=Tubulanus polymorphus TaxID=672921 RepID=UPI003DA66DA6